jgi:hypothetical protein
MLWVVLISTLYCAARIIVASFSITALIHIYVYTYAPNSHPLNHSSISTSHAMGCLDLHFVLCRTYYRSIIQYNFNRYWHLYSSELDRPFSILGHDRLELHLCVKCVLYNIMIKIDLDSMKFIILYDR